MQKLLCLLAIIILIPACALANPLEDSVSALFPNADILASDCHGDTAAVISRHDELLTLHMLEKQNGNWQITLSNPRALRQEEDAPTLLLESENVVFWDYSGMTFSSVRAADSTWGPVNQVMIWPAGGDGSYLQTSLTWDDSARQIIRVTGYYDPEGNPLWDGKPQRVPAPWLSDCICLADFDMSRYPFFEYEEYDGDWPNFPFIEDAAAYLMPDWNCLAGSYTSDECFRFLMDRKDGRRVFVGVTHDLQQTISTPLPARTYYGVENFTTWLGHDTDSFYLALNPDRKTWRLAEVMSWREVSEDLTLSTTHIYNNYTRIVIGEHPWSDITKINWSTLPVTTMDAYWKTDSSRWVIVRNPDPSDLLNLRSDAKRNAIARGRYHTGTPAQILQVEGDWVQVSIGSRKGWMMKKYLEFGDHLITTAEYMPEFDFHSGSGKLYEAATPDAHTTNLGMAYGWRVIGIIGENWYHVWEPRRNEYAFVRQEDVKLK